MPSPSNLEPQYLMVRAIVLARSGDVAGGRALWRRLLDYTHQPAAAPAEQVLRQFMITPAVIERSSQVLRETGIVRSEEHTSELQSLMRISYAVFCLKKKKKQKQYKEQK